MKGKGTLFMTGFLSWAGLGWAELGWAGLGLKKHPNAITIVVFVFLVVGLAGLGRLGLSCGCGMRTSTRL